MNQELFSAIENNDTSTVNKLLGQYSELNIFDKYGDPLITMALHKNNQDIVKMLIHKDIDVNLCDSKGQTALHHAASKGLFEISKLLLEHGGDLSIHDEYGNQPLWTAVFNVKKDLTGLNVVELFLKNGADKNHKNNAGRSPLDFANQVKFAPLLKVLEME